MSPELEPCHWCNSTNGYMVAECIDEFHRIQVFGNSKEDVIKKWNHTKPINF